MGKDYIIIKLEFKKLKKTEIELNRTTLSGKKSK